MSIYSKAVEKGNIAELHEKLMTFLEEKNLCFTHRNPKEDVQGRFTRGYWFEGNEDSLIFSFWKGLDTSSQLPAICLEIESDGTFILNLNGNDSPTKAEFLQDLKSLLSLPFRKNNEANTWYYEYPNSWKESLELFLESKVLIDEYLLHVKGGSVEDISFISEEDFKKSIKFLNVVHRYKLKNLKPKYLEGEGKPLRLKTFRLENIGHFENVYLDLSKRITILIGENGSGKSTILKAIALALSGKAENVNLEVLFEYLRIEGVTDLTRGYADYYRRGSTEIKYEIDTLQMQRIEFKVSELGGTELTSYTDNTGEYLLSKNDHFIDLILGFPTGSRREIHKTTSQLVTPNPNDLLELLEDRDLSKWLTKVVDWMVILARHPEKEIRDKNFTYINYVFNIISKIISNETSETVVSFKAAIHNPETLKKEIIITTPEHPNGISIYRLSLGYVNLITIVGKLVMRLRSALENHQFQETQERNFFLKNPNTFGKRYKANNIQELYGVVIIDELDSHLHPNWQRSVLKVLSKAFSRLQFIVTTNSLFLPSSLENTFEYTIYNIFKDDNNQYLVEEKNPKDFNPFGADLNTVATEVFEIEKRDAYIENLIKALRSAIAHNNVDSANEILSLLKSKINPFDNELVRCEDRLLSHKFTDKIEK